VRVPPEKETALPRRPRPLAGIPSFGDAGSILTDYSEESPAIASRKPPSQRPERKLDETARAIARAKEEASAPKPEKTASATAEPRSILGRAGRDVGGRMGKTPAPTISTKRPKQPGS
jgi:hypothetical protein